MISEFLIPWIITKNLDRSFDFGLDISIELFIVLLESLGIEYIHIYVSSEANSDFVSENGPYFSSVWILDWRYSLSGISIFGVTESMIVYLSDASNHSMLLI